MSDTDLTMVDRFCRECQHRGMRLTKQRRLIVEIVSTMEGHPNVMDVYEHVRKQEDSISLGTVYRTLGLLEEYRLVERRDFGRGNIGNSLRQGVRFENVTQINHHDHLIDIDSGEVLEFQEERIEKLQREVAERMGYELKGHQLELYAVKKKKK